MRILHFITLLGAGSILVNAQTSHAVTYTETETVFDQHNMTGVNGQANPAEAVPYDPNLPAFNLTAINGTISYNTTAATGLTEGDVYQIYISSPTTFSASTPVGGPNVNGFDTQLFLFNANGQGVESNDNDPNGTGGASNLAANPNATFAAGYYFLEITGQSLNPAVSTNGTAIFPDTDPTVTYGPTNATAVFAGYTGSSTEGGEYSIALTGVLTSVPEPSDAVWVVVGAAAGGLILRRRKGSLARA